MTVVNNEVESTNIDRIDAINLSLSRIQAISVLIANSSNGSGHERSIRIAADLIHDEAEKAHELLASAWAGHLEGLVNGANMTPLHRTA